MKPPVLLLLSAALSGIGCSTFAIETLDVPDRATVNGTGGNITVTWSGSPAFPVVLAFRPRPGATCPEGLECLSAIALFNDEENPLVARGVVRCEGEISSPVSLDYEVVLVDEDEEHTESIAVDFTCEP